MISSLPRMVKEPSTDVPGLFCLSTLVEYICRGRVPAATRYTSVRASCASSYLHWRLNIRLRTSNLGKSRRATIRQMEMFKGGMQVRYIGHVPTITHAFRDTDDRCVVFGSALLPIQPRIVLFPASGLHSPPLPLPLVTTSLCSSRTTASPCAVGRTDTPLSPQKGTRQERRPIRQVSESSALRIPALLRFVYALQIVSIVFHLE